MRKVSLKNDFIWRRVKMKTRDGKIPVTSDNCNGTILTYAEKNSKSAKIAWMASLKVYAATGFSIIYHFICDEKWWLETGDVTFKFLGMKYFSSTQKIEKFPILERTNETNSLKKYPKIFRPENNCGIQSM